MRRFTRAAALSAAALACGQTGSPATVVTEPVWHLEVGMATVDGEVGPAAAAYLGNAELGLSSVRS